MTNDKITIIGIAGGTGSGKTTVVKKIVEALPPHHVAVVLIKQINDLREGRAIEQPTYSYLKCNREKETIHVEPKPVIIVEGIMTLLNKRLRDMMDLRIFVDCDPDERLIRNIQRDTIDRGRTVSMVVDRYLKVLKPMHEQFIEPTKRFAHIIIPEGGDNLKGINMVCKYIESIVEK